MPWPVIAGIGAAIAGGASAYGQHQANKTNARLARRQMAFQEYMSSTAIQRRMEDLRKAGLNPMLAYQQGGASSPAGQTATMNDVAGPAVNSAMQARRTMQELKLIKESIREQTAKADMQEDITGAGRIKIDHPQGQFVGKDGKRFTNVAGAERLNALLAQAATAANASSAAALNQADLPARAVSGSTMAGLYNVYGKDLARLIASLGFVKGAGVMVRKTGRR